jgi:hypothetical protein
MPDETSRRNYFVAIDRATRWVFRLIYSDMAEAGGVDLFEVIRLKDCSGGVPDVLEAAQCHCQIEFLMNNLETAMDALLAKSTQSIKIGSSYVGDFCTDGQHT